MKPIPRWKRVLFGMLKNPAVLFGAVTGDTREMPGVISQFG